MKHSYRLVILVFIMLLLSSPFLYPILIRPSAINTGHFSTDAVNKEILADRMNTLRGETTNVLPNAFNKIFVNKYAVSFRYYLENYGKSTDPGYLFFTGGDDNSQYVVQTGALLSTTLILFIPGVFFALTRFKKNIFPIGLLVLSPVPASFLGKPYDSVLLIPFYVVVVFFAARGFVEIYKRKRSVLILILLYFVFELFKFYHTFFNHYLILVS